MSPDRVATDSLAVTLVVLSLLVSAPDSVPRAILGLAVGVLGFAVILWTPVRDLYYRSPKYPPEWILSDYQENVMGGGHVVTFELFTEQVEPCAGEFEFLFSQPVTGDNLNMWFGTPGQCSQQLPRGRYTADGRGIIRYEQSPEGPPIRLEAEMWSGEPLKLYRVRHRLALSD